MNDFNYSITNGTLELSAGGIVLTGVLPYVNEKPVVPLAITSGDEFIRYTIAEGSITLRVRAEDNELVLLTSADIRQGIVHDIEPVGDAVLVNADHVYVQGYGMEGPSGYYAIDNVSRTSHGITGLCSDREAIAIFAADHRRFNLSFSVGSKKTLYSENKYLTAAFDLEGTVFGEIELPELHIIKGEDVVSCMTRAARSIASEMNARTWQEPAFHWCSWYYHYENLDQETLDGFLGKLGAEPVDFRYIQIDAGYTPHIGDWMRFNHRFPEGLGKAATSIAKAGYAPNVIKLMTKQNQLGTAIQAGPSFSCINTGFEGKKMPVVSTASYFSALQAHPSWTRPSMCAVIGFTMVMSQNYAILYVKLIAAPLMCLDK